MSLEVMAEREKQAQNEFHGITPLQASQSLSQPIQSNVSSVYLPTTTSTLDPGTNTNAATIATVPLPSFAVSKDNNSQFEVPEGNVVSHSLLIPALQNITTQQSAAVYQNVSLPKESSVTSGSFLFGPSDDGFGKDQLLCASNGAGNTIPLPVRQSTFTDTTNPLTPVRTKVCTSEYTDQGAPLTPTANLKLLLSAASPAIREREQMQQNTRNVCRSILTDPEVTEEFEYSRKQKSLSILCTRFLEAAESGEIGKNGIFTIEEASTKLDINRRRVYDIVNVLESLEMVSKQKIKNEYKWHGREHLVQTLSRLKEQESGSGGHHTLDHSCAECGQEYGQEYVPRSEKSLGYLCQKFVMLFLESPERELTLEAAAKILLGEEGKVRRLYDVANILTSLGLISKRGFGGGTNFRKPGFFWSGPTVFPKNKGGRSKSDSDEILQRKQQVMSKPLANRNSVLTPIENLPAMKTKSPRSAPSSPVKQKTPLKRYLSFDTTKKKRLQSASCKTPEVRKLLKLSPQDVPENEVKEFEDEFYALLGKFPSIAAQWLPELQSKQGDVNAATAASIYAAAKKAISPANLQVTGLFQDSKPGVVIPTSDNKENWSTALSEQASSAKMQSPSIAMLASRALSMNFPVTKGIVPLPSKNAVTNVTPSSLPQLVSTGGSVATKSDGLITVMPLYTTGGHNVTVHKSVSSAPSLQVPNISPTAVITSVAASLLSAAYKPSNIPTVGQLLQSKQLFALSQKTELNTTTAQ